MRIRQYAYFGLWSRLTPASEMTARLGLEPDEVSVRAARSAAPPLPVSHAWKVVCRDRGLTVDEQTARIVVRLGPFAATIGALGTALQQAEGEVSGARLQIVRYFDDKNGEPELLGWHLDRDLLEFLRVTGADIDVDEYG
ncbi:MAG TPA: DUF4279 domain-containing protein [Pilimelia sp.]|nr:DUF4279 domain-containing protein [Pilimelia sp.]